jgi:hypothetical protein
LALRVAAPILPTGADQPTASAPPHTDALEIASRIDGKVSALARVGQYVYAGVGTYLVVLNWTDPAHPVRAGSVHLDGRALDIHVVGAVAYLAVDTQGLVIINVGDPTKPTLLGTFMPEADGMSKRLVVRGGYVYLLHQGVVMLIDVMHPAAPVYRATLFADRFDGAGPLPKVLDITGDANYLYLVWERRAPTDAGFEVVSVTDPVAPTSVGRCCDGWTFSDLFFEELTVEGTRAQILDLNGVHTIDLTTPSVPHITAFTLIQESIALTVANGLTYVLYRSGDYRTWYIDTIDSMGAQIATYIIPAQSAPVDDIVATGDSLYLINERGIDRLRITAPDRLTPDGRFETVGLLWDVAVAGRYAYSVGDSGFAVLDLAIPEAPQLIASTSVITGYTLGVYMGHAYIRQERDLQIVDITNLSHPVIVGTYAIEGGLWPIGFREHYAYLGSYTRGVEIVDIAAPAAPRKVGVYKPDGYAVDIQVVGQYGYVAWEKEFGGGGLTILDLSDPTAPRVVGTFVDSNLYNTSALALVGSDAYLVAKRGGDLTLMAIVVDIADPARPHEVGHVVLPNEVGGYLDLLVQEDYAYISTPTGLFVVDVIDPDYPTLVGVNYEVNANTKLTAGQTVIYGAGGTLYTLRNQFQGLRGRVVDVHGAAVSDVIVNGDRAGSSVTDGRGRYALHHLVRGSHTLAPARPGYVFIPPQRIVNIPADALDEQRFVMFSAPVSKTLMPGISATLRYTDTQGLVTTWEFPSTAVTTPTTIVIEPQLQVVGPTMVVAGHAWALRASRGGVSLHDFRFEVPIKMTVTYSDEDVWVVTDEHQLWLARQVASGWQDAAEQCAEPPVYTRNLQTNTLAGTLCTSGVFALLGPSHQVYLPVVGR